MIRGLRADEIELRVGQKAKDDSWYTLLLYKDSRCDMNILDELYPNKWQRDHKELKGNIYCGVGIYNDELNEWVWRWDCGTESNTEAAKGEASDSFKRACVNATGCGRELYTAPRIFMNGKVDQKYVSGLYVSEITYDEVETKRTIKTLQIKDRDNKVVFSFGKGTVKSEPKGEDREALIKELKKAIADNPDITEEEFCKATKITKVIELETHRLQGAIKFVNNFREEK